MHKSDKVIKNIAEGWDHHGVHPVIGENWFTKNSSVLFIDNVLYNPYEAKKIIAFGRLRGAAGRNIHNIKKIFNGVIL
jgi:hypothetical protein